MADINIVDGGRKPGGLGLNLNLIIAVVVAAAAISGVAVMYLWGGGPQYQVLYAQLSGEDSSAVIDKLKELKVPYRVDGAAISVPSERVYEVRMELAGAGLPQGGGVGYEIFDKSGFGVTEFVQKVNYKRALQGELARTISQMKEVESARVHLAIPEKGVFVADAEKRARASIILKLRAGKTLAQSQVAAITHLAASSFDNLRAEDVTVVDTTGRLWTKGGADDGAMALSSTQFDYKRGLEKDFEARIQTMLEKTVGVGKVVARVTAEVDTKQVERTEETYNPDGQVVRSEQRNKEKTIGASTAAIGVPGVMSNLPAPEGKPGADTNTKPSESHRQDEIINYEISKVVNRVVEPTGTVKRLSVSVLVDGVYETTKDDEGKDVRKYAPRSDAELAKYGDMVKAAVGFSEKRGDAVSVVNSQFDVEAPQAEIEPEKSPLVPPYLIPSLIRYGSMAAVALLGFILIIRPLLRRLLREAEPKAASFAELQASMPEGVPQNALEAGPPVRNEAAVKMKELVRGNPQQAANVIKGWVKER